MSLYLDNKQSNKMTKPYVIKRCGLCEANTNEKIGGFMENENLVTDVTENVEETTEETINQPEEVPVIKKDTEEEMFTKEQIDDMIAKKMARKEAKIRKEYEKKYSKLENVLKAGTGKDNINDITSSLTDYYERNGIDIPDVSDYTDDDLKTLGAYDADSIINDGFDEVISEVDRLSRLGVDKMTPREKATFEKLANYRQIEEARKELKSKGIGEDILNSKEYKEFTSKLNPNMSEIEKYDMYVKFQPKRAEVMGSMSNKSSGDSGVKDFYTRDEALKFTKEDFDKNPALFKAVENSMLKW